MWLKQYFASFLLADYIKNHALSFYWAFFATKVQITLVRWRQDIHGLLDLRCVSKKLRLARISLLVSGTRDSFTWIVVGWFSVLRTSHFADVSDGNWWDEKKTESNMHLSCQLHAISSVGLRACRCCTGGTRCVALLPIQTQSL